MKKFVALILLIPACGFITNTQSSIGTREQVAAAAPGKTAGLNKEAVMAKAASLAVPFVLNAGRFNKQVRYSADLFSGRFFLTDKELVYSLTKYSGGKSIQPDRHMWSAKPEKNTPVKGIAFKEYFIDEKGGRISFEPAGEEKGTTKVSYFRGNDPSKWQSGLSTYTSVSLGNIYPEIQVKLMTNGKNVEKVFYVGPRADVAEIKIGVAGIKELKISGDGRLLFRNDLADLSMRAPVAWQEIDGQRHNVRVDYHLLGKHLYGFAATGDYDKDLPLVIDPDLVTLPASTLLGGSNYEEGYSLALDKSGNVYITGYTSSKDFPSIGAYDRTYGGREDVFISKLNSDLTVLLASTFLNGSRSQLGSFLTLDDAGAVYLTGYTSSEDFPTTPGAYDRTYNGHLHVHYIPEVDVEFYDLDIFVSKLDSNLTTLLASTYLGGENNEFSYSLTLDSSGNIYLAGGTNSGNFPTTPGAYCRTFHGTEDEGDACVFKLNSDLTRLLASTFLGGHEEEAGNSLKLDNASNVYVAGFTYSTDFPTTSTAYDRKYNGKPPFNMDTKDVFISKLTSDLASLLASTYLGGKEDDECHCLALGRTGNVYLTGLTHSSDFPTTSGTYDQTYNSGSLYHQRGDVFISMLNGDLTNLSASTFLGGNNCDYANSLALDEEDNAYLIGNTESADFPTTLGAYDGRFNCDDLWGPPDVFFSKLDGNLATLLTSTYLGGSSGEIANSLALNNAGNVYITGFTASKDLPTTVGAYDRTSNGLYDVFVSKLKVIALMNIDLLAERREVRAFSIQRQYGLIQFLADVPVMQTSELRFPLNGNRDSHVTPWVEAFFEFKGDGSRAFASVVQIARYRLMRRVGDDDFIVLRTIMPSELQNNQFQMQDKYLDKGTPYSYRVEAYDAAGQLVGISSEKTI